MPTTTAATATGSDQDAAPARRALPPAEFTVAASGMKAALAAAGGVVARRSPKPILQNVLIEVDPGGDSAVTGTDLELGVRAALAGVDASAPCRLVLPPGKLREILDRSGAASLTVRTEGGGDNPVAVLTAGRSTFRLPLEDDALYPEVPGFPGDAGAVEVAAADLLKAIRRTAFATDVESTRYALGGCLVEFDPDAGSLALVGTDGRRLARCRVPALAVGTGIGGAKIVVSVALLRLAERLTDAADGAVRFAATGVVPSHPSGLVFRLGRAVAFGRLVEGRFPRYEDVLGMVNPVTRVTAAAAPLLAAVEQSLIATSDTTRSVEFALEPGGLGIPASVTLRAQAADVGQAEVPLDLDAYDGPAAAFSLDSRYVADALRTLPPDEAVGVDVTDDRTAVRFTAGGDYVYVVMPLTRDR